MIKSKFKAALFTILFTTSFVAISARAEIGSHVSSSAVGDSQLVSFSSDTFAAGATLPVTLEDTMKAMMANMKIVFGQVNDPTKNESSAVLTDEFVALALHSKSFVPDTVTDLPADQQEAAKLRYDQLMDQTADLGQKMAAAFRAGDNVKALDLLKQLNQLRGQGHDEFKGE